MLVSLTSLVVVLSPQEIGVFLDKPPLLILVLERLY